MKPDTHTCARCGHTGEPLAGELYFDLFGKGLRWTCECAECHYWGWSK